MKEGKKKGGKIFSQKPLGPSRPKRKRETKHVSPVKRRGEKKISSCVKEKGKAYHLHKWEGEEDGVLPGKKKKKRGQGERGTGVLRKRSAYSYSLPEWARSKKGGKRDN